MTENPRPDTSPRTAWARRIATAAAVASFAALVLGTATVASAAATAPTGIGPVTNAAERAVVALVADTRPIVPADFVTVMGYRPVVERGRPANPTGDCSSPIPLPERFEPLCREHDFGYDLLRYGARTGEPAAPWARRALDSMLVSAMHRACDDPVCHGAASLAGAGLAANSWRQHWSTPVPETAAQTASTAAVRVVETLAGSR